MHRCGNQQFLSCSHRHTDVLCNKYVCMGVERWHFQSCQLKASLGSWICFWGFCYNPTKVCVCVCVPSYPFFWKQSGVTDSLWPFSVWSVGVMSFAAVTRGVQFPWGKRFGALDFLKDREQEGSLWGRGRFTFCCWLFVLSWGDTPWIVHPPGGDHRCSCVSSWELQESHRRQRNVGNRTGVVLWGLSRFISSLEGHKQWTHTWFAEQINKPFNRLRFCGLIKQVLRIDALCAHLSVIPAKQMCEDLWLN